MIELPANFTSLVSDNATSMIGELAPYASLIIGVLLAATVISLLIHAIKK